MKKRMNFYVLAIVFFSITTISVLLFFHSKKLFSILMQEEKMQLIERITTDLDYSQAIMELVEHQLANDFQEKTITSATNLVAQYNNPENVPIETLKDMASEIGVDHLFLVNKNGVIVNATLQKEINYDLNLEGEVFIKFYAQLFHHHEYKLHGWAISSADKTINAYAYYVPPGSTYAVETSLNLEHYLSRFKSKALENNGLNLVYTDYVDEHRFLNSVDLYNINEAQIYSLVNNKKELLIDSIGWNQLNTKGEFSVQSTLGETYYALIKTNATQKGFPPMLVLEANFDHSKYYELVRYNLMFNGIILLIILIIILIASPYILDKLLITKIDIINYNLNSLRMARYDEFKSFKGKDELSVISENIMHVKDSVVEREKQLQVAKIMAESADRLKTTFLANMSHEIRTPLNAVVGFAQLLRDAEPSPVDVERYVGLININSNRLLQLINDIIDLSQIELNQLKIFPRPVCLEELFNELYANATSKIVSQNQVFTSKELLIQIDVDEAVKKECMVTDPYRLKQILEQLIDNAIKFTCTGEIRMGYSFKEHQVVFFVTDTGVGIAAENISKIFDRFVQAEEYLTREFGGTGLGLAICRELVHILGGKIEVESELNLGSTFRFYLPYKPTLKV